MAAPSKICPIYRTDSLSPRNYCASDAIWSSASCERGRAPTATFGKTSAAPPKCWRILKVDLPVALESYRLARPAFTANGLPTDKEVEDFLRADAEVLKLREPVPAAKIFDFSLQKEVNLELGIK